MLNVGLGDIFDRSIKLKKQAKEEVTKKLQAEQDAIRYKLRAGRRAMKSIVDQQTCLKRELAVLQELIRSMSPNVK